MANISKIKSKDNTVYDIKDSTIRSELDTLKGSYTSLGARVSDYDDKSSSTIAYIDTLIYGE